MINPIFDLTFTTLYIIAVVLLIRFAFPRVIANETSNPAEIAGRVVLIGTFAITGYMLLESFHMRVNTNSFPDIPNGILTLNGAAVAIYIIVQLIASVDSGRDSRLRLVEAQRNSLAHPDNVQYAVDLAAATLEDYLNRNLSQVKWIFNVAVFVMFCGFAVVCYGASIAMGGRIEASLAVSASGIITQFISVTFMVIYRSTMERANSNVTILARINSIGMAVQVLEKMPDSAAELKNTIRADIVRTLLAESEDTQISPARPRKQVAKPHQPESASAPAE